MNKEEKPNINVDVLIKQVKIGDLIMQEAEAMTIIDEEKVSIDIPFEEPITYTYDTLNKDYVFKFAILQNDDLMGILYLEIPYRYKFTKKFKIDDWFTVKPYDKNNLSRDESILARVILTYNANCKLTAEAAKNLGEIVEYRGSPKKEFKAKIREITKDFDKHEKEGFPHLEEVERKIRARRRKNNFNNPSVERAKENGPLSKLNLSSNKGPKRKLKSGSMKKMVKGKKLTPDELYKYGKRRGRGPRGVIDGDKVNQKMVNEMVAMREEIGNLREKLKALENGQMTVDNQELAKQLEQEKEEMGKERMALLKNYVQKEEELEKDKDKFKKSIKKQEQELANIRRQLEDREKKLEVDKIEYEDKLKDAERRLNNAREREKEVDEKQRDLDKDKELLKNEREELDDFNEELENLKDRLLAERERIIEENSKNTKTKMDLERRIKELKIENDVIEKELEKKKAELAKENAQIDKRRERFEKEKKSLEDDRREIEDFKHNYDKKMEEVEKLRDDLENDRLGVWKEKNELQKRIKDFMRDKNLIEKEIKNQKRDINDALKALDEEKEEFAEEEKNLKDLSDDLEKLEEELYQRESRLIDEQANFGKLQKAFFDKLMESGGQNYLNDEMKQLARDLGIDIDKLIEQNKRLEDRQKELEALQKRNKDNMAALKRRQSRIFSAASSRFTSKRGSRRTSRLLQTGDLGKIGSAYKHQIIIAEYLKRLYERSMQENAKRELDKKLEELREREEENEMNKKIAESMIAKNKLLKKELDITRQIIDEMKKSGKHGEIDLSKYFGTKAHKKTDTDDLGFRVITKDPSRDIIGEVLNAHGEKTIPKEEPKKKEPKRFQGKTLKEQLRELLGELRDEQNKNLPAIDNENHDRLRNIQYLVYNFIHNIMQYLLEVGDIKDKYNKELLAVLIKTLKSQMGAGEAMRKSENQLTLDEELQEKLREAYETISKMERKNHFLVDVIESLKNTYEFFEIANDQRILDEKPYAMV